MSDRPSVLVTLDGEVRDPAEPLLTADDLAAVRGDGIFETLLVRAGEACLVESHLRRLVSSAAMLELPAPDLALWRRAIEIAVSQWSAQTADEGALRLVYSRGRETGSEPTAYLMINPVLSRAAAARRDGVSATLLERGLIDEAGRSQYGAICFRTTDLFLRLFGLNSIDDLPPISEWDPSPEEQSDIRERLLAAGGARLGEAPTVDSNEQQPLPSDGSAQPASALAAN